MSRSECYGGTSRRHLVEFLVVLAAAVAYQRAAGLVNEKAYEEFLYKAIRGEIIIRGAASIVRVQGNFRGTWSSGSSFTITMGAAPTNGNIIILTFGVVGGSDAYISSISQTGVTWSGGGNGVQVKNDRNPQDSEIWLGTVGASAGTVITINMNTASIANAIADACEYSGLNPASSGVLDKTATLNTQSVTTGDTGATATTTIANELWVGNIWCEANNGGQSVAQSAPQNGFTLLDGANSTTSGTYMSEGYLEKIVSATGTAQAKDTVATSTLSVGCIATFKASASTPVNVSDSGSGTETAIQPIIAPKDVGSGSEAFSSSVTFGVSDSGSGADSPTEEMDFLDNAIGGETPIWPSLQISDSGVGTEAEASSVTFSVGDSGSGSENPIEWMYYTDKSNRINVPGGNVNLSLYDSGAGVDVIALQVTFGVADAGSGSEVTTLKVSFSSADSGLGSDAFTNGLPAGDSGGGSDATTLQATFTVGDTGSGAEAATEGLSGSDLGLGSETQTLQASFTANDSGLGSETSVLQVTFTVNDSGAGAEIFGKNFTAFDVGAGSEVYALTGTINTSDTGVGFENFTFVFNISVADFTQGLDESSSPSYTGIVRLRIPDSGSGSDRFAIRVLLSGQLQYVVTLTATEDEYDPTAYDPYTYS
jgi:hypothetical protein